MSERKWEEELIERLTELANLDSPNRAVLAHLRRGLERPLDYTLGRVGWLFRRVPESKDDLLLRNAILAAGLFAWVKGECPHQRPSPNSESKQKNGPNFGSAFGADLTQEQKQQREKRFIDLLDTDADELSYKLRQAITLIARDKVRLDWVLLIQNLNSWADANANRRVQKDWARGFWSAPEAEITTDQEQSVSK